VAGAKPPEMKIGEFVAAPLNRLPQIVGSPDDLFKTAR
jgi:hypothetical protein